MSDILIRGIEMPKTCGKCMIKNAIECNRWRLVRSVVLDRHKDCPLVEIPPHGRLIDADALRAFAYERQKETGIACCVDALDISLAPTIIPAEEGSDG